MGKKSSAKKWNKASVIVEKTETGKNFVFTPAPATLAGFLGAAPNPPMTSRDFDTLYRDDSAMRLIVNQLRG